MNEEERNKAAHVAKLADCGVRYSCLRRTSGLVQELLIDGYSLLEIAFALEHARAALLSDIRIPIDD